MALAKQEVKPMLEQNYTKEIDDMIKMQQDQTQENGYEKAMREGTLNG